MTLNVRNEEAGRLVSELVALTGRSITEIVVEALRHQLDRERARRKGELPLAHIDEIANEFAALAQASGRHASEVVPYDENGLPT